MEQALMAREILIKLFKRYEPLILFFLKFIAGIFIFGIINGIGRVLPELSKIFSPNKSLIFVLLLALLFAVLPTILEYVLIIFYLGIQMSGVLEVAVTTVLFLSLITIFYSRLASKENVLLLIMFFCFYFKIPYLVPILAGMYFSVTSVIPIILGVFIWQYIPIVQSLLDVTETVGINITDMPGAYSSIYEYYMQSFTTNTDWIVIGFVLSLVVLAVYAVSQMSFDFSREIAIAIGGFLTILGLGVASFMGSININIVGVIFSTLASVLIMYAVRFFDVVLDYSSAEKVYFQDEENVYYVKIIPKVILTKTKRRPKRQYEE